MASLSNGLPHLSPHITIRAYNKKTDGPRVDELEKLCEAGPSGSVSLFTDLLGDPLCRVRHFPAYAMLVAEVDTELEVEIVGMIRAGIKEVVCGQNTQSGQRKLSSNSAVDYAEDIAAGTFAPTAYILGLRVAPQYRRLGIGVELVKQMELWCKEQGAEYAYIATEKDNEASVNLFTRKLGYSKFRTPAILVQPVYTRSKKISSKVQIVELSRERAEALYRCAFREREFFPKDVDAIMRSRLHKGTWMARWRGEEEGDESAHSWAVLSLWKCNEIFKLELKGAPLSMRGAVAAARFVGKLMRKVATVPTPPNVFRPFGLQLVYGLHAQGVKAPELVKELCWFAHNMAKQDGCAVVAAEVGSCDPLRAYVPHWPRLSCDEDLWCIKHLITTTTTTTSSLMDWCRRPPPASIFVDPRDF